MLELLLHLDVSTAGGIVFVRIGTLEEERVEMNGNDRDLLVDDSDNFLRLSDDTSRINTCKTCSGYVLAIFEYLKLNEYTHIDASTNY